MSLDDVIIPLALVGTGTVGSAVLDRLQRLQAHAGARRLRLVQVANRRQHLRSEQGLEAARVLAALTDSGPAPLASIAAGWRAPGVIIDATASDEVADRHARWLRVGHAVVSANKAGIGGAQQRHDDIARHRARYGDAATVGAGLPVLRSLRELRAGGDRILGLAGVLSGSLSWLFQHYDGRRPFSELVREARALGYAEPDPRTDLSGEDVRRKLAILARAAGQRLEPATMPVQSLLPGDLARAPFADLDRRLGELDAPMRARWEAASARGRVLRYVARWDETAGARQGLEALPADDPLAVGGGCDNRVAIWSCRYRERPLVVQGPGAGAEVTAAALLDDAFRLAPGLAATAPVSASRSAGA